MRETLAIIKNPADTYPLNCKALGPIFQGNPYNMTSYSPPLTHGRLSCWHSRCRDSIKAMGGTTSNEAGRADGTPLPHMDPPKKNSGGPIRGSHGFFPNGAKTTGSCILYVLFVYILTIHCLP